MQKNKTLLAVILITSLFFLWGFVLNLNPILIPHLKKACRLTDLQSAFIDSAFYIAYFVIAIPAGQFMKKFGYKGGIILGLLLFAFGAYLFYPAAETRMFGFFLVALFIIACGLTFLETAANPYISVLGDPETSTQRLNFAQSFNGLAAALAPLMGSVFILSGKSLSSEQELSMSAQEVENYLVMEATAVQIPYLVIGSVVLLVALFFWKTRLPKISEEGDGQASSIKSVLKEKNLMLGVVSQFFYVGAQVCVSSFFIRFSEQAAGLGEKAAGALLSVALLGFMIGRFFGTFLMKFVSPAKLLAFYSIVNFFLIIIAVMVEGRFAVYMLIAVEFFMSIMFPTIFALSIRGLGAKTKEGSSLLIMSIVGGAIFPVLMGRISDISDMQTAYLVPSVCFLVVFYFALKNLSVGKVNVAVSH